MYAAIYLQSYLTRRFSCSNKLTLHTTSKGSEHGPLDTERHRSTEPSSHVRHRTWRYSLRREWDRGSIERTCASAYCTVFVCLFSETKVFGMAGVEPAPSHFVFCALVAQEFGPTLSKSKPRLRHAEAWPNRPKNGLVYHLFIITPKKKT